MTRDILIKDKSGHRSLHDLKPDVRIPVHSLNLFTDEFTWNGDTTHWDQAEERRDVKSENESSWHYCRYDDKDTMTVVRRAKRWLKLEMVLHRILHIADTESIAPQQLSFIKNNYIPVLLKPLGVVCDPDALRIRRLDVYADFPLNIPTSRMIEDLNRIAYVNRLRKSVSSDNHADTYLRWGKDQRAFTIYDKTSQLRERGYEKELPQWFLRLELRYMNAQAANQSGLTYFDDLLDASKLMSRLKAITGSLYEAAQMSGVGKGAERSGAYLKPLLSCLQKERPSVKEFERILATAGLSVIEAALGGANYLLGYIQDLPMARDRRRGLRLKIAELNERRMPLDTNQHTSMTELKRIIECIEKEAE